MASGVKGVIEYKDILFDFLRVISPVSTVILESIDFVSSPYIEGRSVEETGVGVSLSKLVNYGLNSPEFLFLLKDVTIFSSEPYFKVMEERVDRVRRSYLDAS